MQYLHIVCLLLSLSFVFSLENGLARTPPMGWLTWERYRCIVDCDTSPDECISERLITRATDLLVSEGYAAAGYEYVGIDDCWLEMEREAVNGEEVLVPNRKSFPNGMKYVADYIHKKGLKFGIYQDYGTKTCAGYPGILNHMEVDAKTFGSWDVDYVKLDGCNVDLKSMDKGYPEFGRLLNATGRPMLYSCSWPVYQEYSGMKPDFESIIKHCNMWRNYGDIDDSYASLKSIMNYFGKNSKRLATYAGPGHWNDPDMLIIGNYGLSVDQSRIQMAVWAILAAPLLLSTDLERVRPDYKDIILNRKVIAVNQDPLGRAGYVILEQGTVTVWMREITPVVNGFPSLAFAFVSSHTDGAPNTEKFSFTNLGLNETLSYKITDLFSTMDREISVTMEDGNKMLTTKINPTGVRMYKFEVRDSTGFKPESEPNNNMEFML